MVLTTLLDRQHPIERDPRPVLLVVGHDDAVVDAPVDQLLEDPEQVVRRHAEHRRAEAAELIERQHGALGRELVGQAVHEVHLGADRPDRACRAVA